MTWRPDVPWQAAGRAMSCGKRSATGERQLLLSLYSPPSKRQSIHRRLYADVLSSVLYTTNLLAIGPPERNLEVSLTHLSAVPFLGDGFLRKLTAFLLRKEPLWSTNSRVFVSHRTVKAALK